MSSLGITLSPCVCMFIILIISIGAVENYQERNSWVEPDAWSKRSHDNSNVPTNTECTSCNECHAMQKTPSDIIESNVTMLYFKRLVRLLFNRKYMIYDSVAKSHKLDVRLLVTPHQLEELEKADNPRAVDGLVTEIFKNVFVPRCNGHIEYGATNFNAALFKLWRDMWKLIDTSEIRFILIFILIMACVVILSRRWGISYIALGIMSMFLFGFLHTYLECNRELKVNEVIEDLKEREAKKWGLIGYIKSWFIDPENDLTSTILKLKKSAKINWGFCRPDDVVLMYINDVLLKYVRSLMHECTSSLTILLKSLPFPYNIIAAPMLIAFLVYLLKLIFKYVISPVVWSAYATSCTNSSCHKVPSIKGHICNNNEDKLSGDNLALFLKAVNCIGTGSGVEDIEDLKKVVTSYKGSLMQLMQPIKQLSSSPSSITLEPTSEPLLIDKKKSYDNSERQDEVDVAKVTLQDVTEN